MVLVVLRHLTLWIENEFNEGPATLWWHFSELLGPVRMPLFFLISGYLVANAVKRPLGQSRARTLGFFYLYVVWTGLFLARLWIPAPGISDDSPSPMYFFIALLLPTVFWYIWALALYFLASWAADRVFGASAGWLVLPLFVLAFFAPLLNEIFIPMIPGPIDALKVGSIALNFVWFYAGVHGRSVWDRAMGSATVRSALTWTAIYLAAFAVTTAAGLRTVLFPLLALLALTAVAHAIPLLRAPRIVVEGLESVGALTLPVYIFHIFGISAISLLVKASGLGDLIASTMSISAILIPPVLTVVLIWVSMAMGRVILGSPMRWLMTPDWLKGASGKVAVRQS